MTRHSADYSSAFCPSVALCEGGAANSRSLNYEKRKGAAISLRDWRPPLFKLRAVTRLPAFLLSPPLEDSFDIRDSEVVHHHRDKHDGIDNFVTKVIASEIHNLLRHSVARDDRNWNHRENKNECEDDVEDRGNENGEESVNGNAH